MNKNRETKFRVRVMVGLSKEDLLVSCPPDLSISSVARRIKEISKHPDVNKALASRNRDCGVKVVENAGVMVGITIYDSKDCPEAA